MLLYVHRHLCVTCVLYVQRGREAERRFRFDCVVTTRALFCCTFQPLPPVLLMGICGHLWASRYVNARAGRENGGRKAGEGVACDAAELRAVLPFSANVMPRRFALAQSKQRE